MTDTIPSAWPPVFTLDTEAVLRLFTGDRFYSSSDAGLREAILNAIDACGRRQDSDPNHESTITVTFDDDARTVTVRDNGIGMTQEDLTNLFAKVGASAAKLVEQPEASAYKSIGEFGIGVVSYFLMAKRFQLHTTKVGVGEAIGLEFSDGMLDGETPALSIEGRQSEPGTTLVLMVRDGIEIDFLVKRFAHWVRDVEGLNAVRMPRNEAIQQGGASHEVKHTAVQLPEWAERVTVGPPEKFEVWNRFDGQAHVDILYRGVFVDRMDIPGLWGTEGSIDVDPKHEAFKPKLNREGFVGEQLKGHLTRFLQQVHPQILETAVECLRDVLADDRTKEWTIQRWVTLWLAVPRSGDYAKAAALWDAEFQQRNSFRILGLESQPRDVSVAELQALDVEQIYLAPLALGQAGAIVQQAVRVLRARGEPVVQGIGRESGFLAGVASWAAQETSELLFQYFRESLPKVVKVGDVAQAIVGQEGIAEVFDEPPRVRIVRLGDHAAPIVTVGGEIWVNLESENGRRMIEEVCDRNEGHLGLWVACLRHAPDEVAAVASVLRNVTKTAVVGPVKRRFLRGLSR